MQESWTENPVESVTITADFSNKKYEEAMEKLSKDPKDVVEFNCTPTEPIYERNKFGLLKNLNYVFNEDGTVNYKAMLKPEHLVLNRQKKEEIEKEYGKKITDIDIVKDKVDDKFILILLAGIRWLAMIRGFTRVNFSYTSSDERADARCTIYFIGNYETGYNPVEFESTAERSRATTVPPFNNHLVSLAENAAFSRTVRNFLQIPVLAQDEILGVSEVNTVEEERVPSTHPAAILESFLRDNEFTFEQLKKKLIEKVDDKGQRIYPKAEEWNRCLDIPKTTIMKILSNLKKKN